MLQAGFNDLLPPRLRKVLRRNNKLCPGPADQEVCQPFSGIDADPFHLFPHLARFIVNKCHHPVVDARIFIERSFCDQPGLPRSEDDNIRTLTRWCGHLHICHLHNYPKGCHDQHSGDKVNNNDREWNKKQTIYTIKGDKVGKHKNKAAGKDHQKNAYDIFGAGIPDDPYISSSNQEAYHPDKDNVGKHFRENIHLHLRNGKVKPQEVSKHHRGYHYEHINDKDDNPWCIFYGAKHFQI